jgi:hypothetical protein
MDQVEEFMINAVCQTSKKEVMSICGFGYIFSDNVWTILI